MVRWLIGLLAQLALRIAYLAHQAEGLNVLFLILPARFVAQTLRRYGAIIGDDVEINIPITFHNTSTAPGQHYANLQVGANCYFGKEVFLDLADKIEIEDNVTISMRVMILTHTHAGRSPLSDGRLPPHYASIHLKRGCYIGAGAILLPGVEIGEEAIVGAGAVVTRSVDPKVTVAGVPAVTINKV